MMGSPLNLGRHEKEPPDYGQTALLKVVPRRKN